MGNSKRITSATADRSLSLKFPLHSTDEVGEESFWPQKYYDTGKFFFFKKVSIRDSNIREQTTKKKPDDFDHDSEATYNLEQLELVILQPALSTYHSVFSPQAAVSVGRHGTAFIYSNLLCCSL